ncbi:hypothetical protein KO504_16910 [Winogradskyella psychrotolerans]|uniref:hypothetical protein n=1 Tax=Winogradskyella psychrotolerans TaxID=1344585 RepID=UPI001C072F7D|nr:hypothetical protein [Winogradskyella psychrotolerans]MBU2923032.1 hypothetical protein [Winogradskyella psychrotolerans]
MAAPDTLKTASEIAAILVNANCSWKEAQDIVKSINYEFKKQTIIPLVKKGLNDWNISQKTGIAPASVGYITTEYWKQKQQNK